MLGLNAQEAEKARQNTLYGDWITARLAELETHYRTEAPTRTDEGDAAATSLAPVYTASQKSALTHRQMKDYLVETFGLQCWGCTFQAPRRAVPTTRPRGPEHRRRLQPPGQPRAALPALQPGQVGPDNTDTAPARERPEQIPYQASRDQARSGRSPHRPAKRTTEMPGGAGEAPPRASNSNRIRDNVVANNAREKGAK